MYGPLPEYGIGCDQKDNGAMQLLQTFRVEEVSVSLGQKIKVCSMLDMTMMCVVVVVAGTSPNSRRYRARVT